MFAFVAVVGGCSDLPWFMYQMSANLFDTMSNGSSSLSYEFKYIGDGYSGVDDRINRAYGYSDNDVWWFELSSNGDDSYASVTFSTADLTDWWILMWILVGILLCCCCICVCICCCRKRRKKSEEKRRHFHASVAV